MKDSVEIEVGDWRMATLVWIMAYPIIRDIIIQAEIDDAFKIDWRWIMGRYEQYDR